MPKKFCRTYFDCNVMTLAPNGALLHCNDTDCNYIVRQNTQQASDKCLSRTKGASIVLDSTMHVIVAFLEDKAVSQNGKYIAFTAQITCANHLWQLPACLARLAQHQSSFKAIWFIER